VRLPSAVLEISGDVTGPGVRRDRVYDGRVGGVGVGVGVGGGGGGGGVGQYEQLHCLLGGGDALAGHQRTHGSYGRDDVRCHASAVGRRRARRRNVARSPAVGALHALRWYRWRRRVARKGLEPAII
jgi:hypothetical protein